MPKQLPGNLKEAVAAVARSQEGYQQTETKKDGAWSRYGTFMGDPSADPWDAEFVLFTLHYAGALDALAKHPDVPADADTVDWIKQLREKDMLLAVNDYSPETGDIVFLSAESAAGGNSARAAVVVEGGKDSVRVIGQGTGGNSNQVCEETCSSHDILFCAVPAPGTGFAKASDILVKEDKDAKSEEEAEEESEEKAEEESEEESDFVTLGNLT